MKNAFRDYICFTDMENIESSNQQMKESFLFKENEISELLNIELAAGLTLIAEGSPPKAPKAPLIALRK